jgi:hypothetical protein
VGDGVFGHCLGPPSRREARTDTGHPALAQ